MANSENRILGTVGALLGAILGIVVWCLIGKLGYISWIGGLAISGLSFGGYVLLGKGFSGIGMLISGIIIVISVYFATRLNYAITIYDAFKDEGYNTTLFNCFSSIMDLLDLVGETSKFYTDLAIGYVFTVIAGVGTARRFLA